MIGEVQYMRKGQVYRIKNRKTDKYLTSGLQINAMPYTQGKISQLWLLDEVKPTLYEIVSLQSGQVMTRNQVLNLEKGKWGNNQFWLLKRAELTKNVSYFWITASDVENMYLFGSGGSHKVHMKNYDHTLFASNWQIQECSLKDDLGGCCCFVSSLSKLVIDVPQASTKEGVAVIQYSFNGRGNQRWIFQKIQDSYIIRNLCSSLVLAPQKKGKNGSKIIQTTFQNFDEHRWKVQVIKDKKVRIKSVAEGDLYLGVSSAKESAYIVLSNQEDKIQWELDGYMPQIYPQ